MRWGWTIWKGPALSWQNDTCLERHFDHPSSITSKCCSIFLMLWKGYDRKNSSLELCSYFHRSELNGPSVPFNLCIMHLTTLLCSARREIFDLTKRDFICSACSHPSASEREWILISHQKYLCKLFNLHL